jgi:hypothetical protein
LGGCDGKGSKRNVGLSGSIIATDMCLPDCFMIWYTCEILIPSFSDIVKIDMVFVSEEHYMHFGRLSVVGRHERRTEVLLKYVSMVSYF